MKALILRIAILILIVVYMVFGGVNDKSDFRINPETGERQKVIKMGLVPSEDAGIVLEEGDKMADLLTEMTGVPFRSYVTPNYNTLVAAMRAGDVDFAWLPVLAYVKSSLDGTGTALLKAVRGVNPYYYGAIIVRRDRGYKSIQDLKGKVMGWGDILSFSGHVYPKYDLIQKKIYTKDFFSKETNLGNHPAVVKSVLNGHIDAGAVWANDTEGITGAWLLQERKEDRDAIVAIYYTEPIPGDTFTVRTKYLEENRELTEKIRLAVIAMADDPLGKSILKNIYRIDRMIPAIDSDYAVVYEAFNEVLRK